MHVVMHDLETGQSKELDEPYDQESWPPYAWAEGNENCDCNRGLLMGIDVDCGWKRFAVVLTDGARRYDDTARTKDGR